MVTRITKHQQRIAQALEQPFSNPVPYRRLSLFIADSGYGLSGSVQWHDGYEYVECVVRAGGPFEEPTELLTRLLAEQRLRPQLPTTE